MIKTESDLFQFIEEFPNFSSQQQNDRFRLLQEKYSPAKAIQALDTILTTKSSDLPSEQAIDQFYISLGKSSLSDPSMAFFNYYIKEKNDNATFLFLERLGQIENPDRLLKILEMAIESGRPTLVRKLLEKCQNKEAARELLFPCLIEAILNGEQFAVQTVFNVSHGLLEFDLNQKLKDGLTLLQYAAFWGNEKALDKLLELGANPNHKDHEDSTALHYLGYGFGQNYHSEQVYQSMFNKLLARGGDGGARNHFYETAEAAKVGPASFSSLEMVLLSANGFINDEIEMGIAMDYPITEQICNELKKRVHEKFPVQTLIKGIVQEDYNGGDYEGIYDRIRKGELIVLSTGWRGHNIYLVFFENQMVICNRAAEKFPTLALWNINTELLTPTHIADFHLRLIGAEPSEGERFFYEDFIQLLQANQSKFQMILTTFSNKNQKMGNCRMNIKSAIRAATILLMYKTKKINVPFLFHSLKQSAKEFNRCCREGKKFSKEISNQHRASLLELYRRHRRREDALIEAVQARIEYRLERHNSPAAR